MTLSRESPQTSTPDLAQTREVVQRRYGPEALKVLNADGPARDPFLATCGPVDRSVAGENVPQAALDASLGCGNPVVMADLRPGETVLDLGSGGGLDVLLSARRVAPSGMAYGLDLTEEMLELARRNQREAGVANAEFLHGSVEAIPLPDASVDVVLSNCVINLSVDKPATFSEMFRVLRSGGRLAIADIVTTERADLAAMEPSPCLAGALSSYDYRRGLERAGFTAIAIEGTHEVAPQYSSVIVRARKA